MATALAAVEQREVVRCEHCQLVQFKRKDERCARCRSPYKVEEKIVEIVEQPRPQLLPKVVSVKPPAGRGLDVARSLRNFRLGFGWSQADFARRMGCYRTYVSKVEHRTCVPTLGQLKKLAGVFGVTVNEFLAGDPEVCLGNDSFILEIAQDIRNLDTRQRGKVLDVVRRMSVPWRSH